MTSAKTKKEIREEIKRIKQVVLPALKQEGRWLAYSGQVDYLVKLQYKLKA